MSELVQPLYRPGARAPYRSSTAVRLSMAIEAVASGCWEWRRFRRDGYGLFSPNRGRSVNAHRAVYEINVGPVPDGLVLDHLCRNRACCNPAHLDPVTQQINILRGEGLAADEARRTHCPSGHPYDEENTYVIPSRPNARYCRECARRHRAEHRRRRAA